MMALTITGAGALEAVQAAGHPALTSATVLAKPQQAPQQRPQQAPGGAASAGGAGLIIVVILGFLIYRLIDKNKLKWGPAIMCFTMGALLAGSMFGLMAKQVAGSLGAGAASMFSTVTTNGASGTGSSGNGDTPLGDGAGGGNGR